MKTLGLWLLTSLTFVTADAFAAAPPGRRVPVDALGDPLPHGAIARLGTTRHRTAASHAALSPDGRLIAAFHEGDKPRVVLTDAVTGLEKRSFQVDGEHSHLAFSPDGKAVVAVDGSVPDEPTVVFYEAATGKRLRQIRGVSVRAGLSLSA